MLFKLELKLLLLLLALLLYEKLVDKDALELVVFGVFVG
jgi:hypothetical protein